MVRPKKHLGQHFLKQSEIAKRISDSISVNTQYRVEVGPGTGMLTQYLLQPNIVLYAFEVDKESVEYLQDNYNQENFHLLHQDFLSADLKRQIPGIFVLAGNFPYNISTQIIFKMLENHSQIPQLVGMFQKEVAERICASSGSKVYGITSVMTQLYYDAEYLFTVDEDAFEPPPKVKSGVIRLTIKKEIPNIDTDLFKRVVKTAFNQRRKKLSNALKPMGIPDSLINHNFLNLRAEQLSVAQFIELVNLWND